MSPRKNEEGEVVGDALKGVPVTRVDADKEFNILNVPEIVPLLESSGLSVS